MTEEEIRTILEEKVTQQLKYTICEGDTLKNIAFRVYGDIRAVDIICYFNEITSDDDLIIGNKLTLPFADETKLLDFFDYYGTDFQLDANGNLNISGDIQSVTGLRNVIEALTRRIETQVGTYLRNLDYGRGFYVGFPQKEFFLKMAKLKALEAVLQDDRIQSVDNVDFQIHNTEVLITIDMSTRLLDHFTLRINTSF